MQANVEQSPSTTTPAAGPVLAEGEVLVGVTVHDNAPHWLIRLPAEAPRAMTWEKAKAWAAEQGGELPSRVDALILFERDREAFKRDWYWTSAPVAGGSYCAWCQNFLDGSQYWDLQSGRCRARAVRRVAIR